MPEGVEVRKVLEIEGMTKHFGASRPALDNVKLTVAAGEVHGLLGSNGSGKSTLIKVLDGVEAPDPGASVSLAGTPLSLPLHPGEIRKHGVAFVHQDLGLVPSLSVLENLRVGRWQSKGLQRIRWADERRRIQDLMDRFGISVDLNSQVSHYSEATRAKLAIARAMHALDGSTDQLLVLDEPTTHLAGEAVSDLFDTVRTAASEGAGVLFVTHRLSEVFEICDRVTVLRDGHVALTGSPEQLGERRILETITGVSQQPAHDAQRNTAHKPGGSPILRVDVSEGSGLRDLKFDAYQGEILGVTGLPGSGFENVPQVLMGEQATYRGEIHVGSTAISQSLSTHKRVKQGLLLVPADRRKSGLALGLRARENLTFNRLAEFTRYGRIQRSREKKDAQSWMERLNVTPSGPERRTSTFSGGNQQKVVLARSIASSPRVLLLHEPTQGVDVGARAEIRTLISQLAAEGMTIVVFSLDYDDLAKMCTRVVILHNGTAAGEVTGEKIESNRIAEACYSAREAEAEI